MLCPSCAKDRVDYLNFMLDFFFKVIMELNKVKFYSEFRAEMATSLQKMYSKGKSMCELLNGHCQQFGSFELSCAPDHTILFTILRCAYEQLMTFELVYIIPDTADKRNLMEIICKVAGLTIKQKMIELCDMEQKQDIISSIDEEIKEYREVIYDNSLYQCFSESQKRELEKQVFKNGDYNIVFTADGFKSHVGWDDIRSYCQLSTTAFDNIYKYACNMAHPSYMSLQQFCNAYKEMELGN